MVVKRTLEEHKAAKATLQAVQERWENYTGINPDKYRSELREARECLATIEAELKHHGLLPQTDAEHLHAALDRAFPDARTKEIVTFEGVRYQRRFYPATRSNSGKTVRSWERTWERLPGGDG